MALERVRPAGVAEHGAAVVGEVRGDEAVLEVRVERLDAAGAGVHAEADLGVLAEEVRQHAGAVRVRLQRHEPADERRDAQPRDAPEVAAVGLDLEQVVRRGIVAPPALAVVDDAVDRPQRVQRPPVARDPLPLVPVGLRGVEVRGRAEVAAARAAVHERPRVGREREAADVPARRAGLRSRADGVDPQAAVAHAPQQARVGREVQVADQRARADTAGRAAAVGAADDDAIGRGGLDPRHPAAVVGDRRRVARPEQVPVRPVVVRDVDLRARRGRALDVDERRVRGRRRPQGEHRAEQDRELPIRQTFSLLAGDPSSRCPGGNLASLLRARATAAALDLAAPLLGVDPAALGAGRRACGPPGATDLERGAEPRRQALERQLAIAQLRAGVLRRGGDTRSEPAGDPRLLGVAQGGRGVHVEHRLHARGGDVRVLTAGPRGAAGAQLDLGQRDGDAGADVEPIGHLPG